MPISPATLNGYSFNSNAEENIYIAAKESGYFDNTERYLFHSLNIVKTSNKKNNEVYTINIFYSFFHFRFVPANPGCKTPDHYNYGRRNR